MQEDQNAGSETQPEGVDVTPAEGEENVEEQANPESPEEVALKVLNEATGEQFKDLDTAKKSIGDLKSYTGMKKEDAAKKLEESGEYVSKQELEAKINEVVGDIKHQAFFDKNEALVPFRDTIETVAKAKGMTPAEVVEKDESLSALITGKQEFDTISKQKTVMESNPRTLAANSKLDEAKEAAKIGDKATAESKVGGAVLEAIGLAK